MRHLLKKMLNLVTSWYFYIFYEVQNFLGNSFYYIRFVIMQDFCGTSFFDSSCFSVFLWYLAFWYVILIFSWIFMVSTFLVYLLYFRIFLIPCFPKCNIWFRIFHIFFFLILFYGFPFTVISLLNCLSFLFWIIMIFSLFSIQISLPLCWQLLLFNKHLMGHLVLNFYKLR